MDLTRITIASRTGVYPIQIGCGAAGRLEEILRDAAVPPRRFVVSNPEVWKLHGRRLGPSEDEPILIPDGERFKHLQTVSRIYEALIRAGADRGSAIVALGGGVVGDIAGFAAATYLRGIALVHVPTTLLAQVDSAIGGKVGVNHPLGKNLIGAIYAPRTVAVDPELLATLPRREFRSGLYEVIKYGLIASRPLFDRVAGNLPALFARDPAVLVPVIAECCRIKAAIVEADETELGPRRVLNLGHTVGHALEAITRYRRFRHGEAVAYGLLAACEVADGRTALAGADRETIRALILQMGPLPTIADLSAAQALDAIKHDKKVVDGRLHFALPTGIGAVALVNDVKEKEIERALRRIGLKK
jgi:3-dehydroquinate synthase